MRLPAMRSWKLLRATGAQSAASSRCAPSKKGALGGTRSSFIGHCGLCGSVLAAGVVGLGVSLLLRYSCTSFWSNSSASRSVIVMASWGQCPRHAPNPSQYVSLTSRALPLIIWSAPSAHLGMHAPHPLHFDSSICTIFRFTLYSSLHFPP